MSRFFNRELSWIEFNARVLDEALRGDVPLLERLRFLCIVASNFDEFYMVRVATVRRQLRAGNRTTCPSGLSPAQQLERIHTRIRELITRKYRCLLDELVPKLAENGLKYLRPSQYSPEQAKLLTRRFHEEILPVLSPVRASPEAGLPYIPNLRLHAAFLLEPTSDQELLHGDDEQAGRHLAIVQIPQSLPRIVFLSQDDDETSFGLLEDVVSEHASILFPGYGIVEHGFFRITRDADLDVDDEQEDGFLEAMEQVLVRREYSDAVRLAVSDGAPRLRDTLAEVFGLSDEEVYTKPEPLDVAGFMSVVNLSQFDHLRYQPWPVTEPPELAEEVDLWATIKRQDHLLHHPYESFAPVVRLVTEAADDPDVLAIKMTLYRTSGDSRIIAALERAADQGKQVTVLVELKARFDEHRNITWAQRLERAGAIVIHGVAGLKVHAKVLLIVRREDRGVRRYVHLGTGNYNEKTARLYTDIGLFTARETIGYEAGLFFNAITGYSAAPTLSALAMAPIGLKRRVLQLISRESMRAKAGSPASILAKMNSLADPEVIEALYEASQAGVQIRLNVRGVCMLVPGVRALSENITVVSIIDRYLEHARVFCFHNEGSPEVFASSADWMPRNLERRVELLFPIEDPELVSRAIAMLELAFSDTTNSHLLHSDGCYTRRRPNRNQEPLRSQEANAERCARRAASTETDDSMVFDIHRSAPDDT